MRKLYIGYQPSQEVGYWQIMMQSLQTWSGFDWIMMESLWIGSDVLAHNDGISLNRKWYVINQWWIKRVRTPRPWKNSMTFPWLSITVDIIFHDIYNSDIRCIFSIHMFYIKLKYGLCHVGFTNSRLNCKMFFRMKAPRLMVNMVQLGEFSSLFHHEANFRDI